MLASQVICVQNILISVNQSGCSTRDTLHDAYKKLFDSVIEPKRQQSRKEEDKHVIIADGHKSRFDAKVLRLCQEKEMEQFILWPDTSGFRIQDSRFKSLSLITRGYTRKHKIHRQQIQTIQNLNHNGNILLLMIVDTLV